MSAAVCWGLFRFAHYLHPYLSLPLALALIGLAVSVGFWVRKKDVQAGLPTYMMLGYFGLFVAIGVAGFSSISYFLHSSGLAHFEHAAPPAPGTAAPPPDFPAFYFWHFLKLLPLGIEDAWGEPLKHSGAGAGLPLVLFRVMIIIPLLSLFKKWWDERRRADEARAPRQTVAPGPARIEAGNV
jgi:hypothetical protein